MKAFTVLCLIVWTIVVMAFVEHSTAGEEKNPYNGEAVIALCLQKSDWVVVGTFKRPVEEGVGVGGGAIAEPNVPVLRSISITADVEVQEIIKGEALPDRPALIELCYLVADEVIKPVVGSIRLDSQAKVVPPRYDGGKKYILFLQKYPPGSMASANGRVCTARTTDPWVGVLPYNEAFALALREVASATR